MGLQNDVELTLNVLWKLTKLKPTANGDARPT
jgi:hypothetical protein